MTETIKHLNEADFKETFADPMQQVEKNTEPPFDFWDYFDHIPEDHFEGHDCSSGRVTYVWTDARGRYQHVLVNSEDKNVFMVLVLDLQSSSVYGHRLLDLNREYGLYDKANKFVIYQGERMIQGWPRKIQRAQKHPSVLIQGKKLERIRYGSEKDDWGANEHGCHDCRVIKGQVHVWGCDGEECPNCGGQLISCDCEPEEL